ncbi:MAG TPA: ATP-binding protein, partial [Actinomycetota bacterium]|nr:ATP-binding protein [Actinomycetota bacterium]
YQGLQPFAEPDAPYFFGRDGERTILAANLMAAKLTLVYGASGVGKSSVLRAGVVHQLREQEARVDHTAGAPRLVVVYVNEWSGDAVARLLDRVGEEVALVLEEPGPLERPLSGGLAETLAAWTARRHLELLVILDQFEEYFLYHRDEDGPGSFAAEFPPAVDRADLPVSFLVAIREDALARLDRFKGRIPNLFENYVRIRHLSVSQAEAAILEPLRRHNQLLGDQEPWTAEPELVRRVLEGVRVGRVVLAVVGRGGAAGAAGDLPDPPIEAPYLQMVLTRLWAREAEEGSRRLRVSTLEALGGPERIVRTHLDEALDGLPPEQQEVAAAVFHYLVTPSGSKIGHSAVDLANYTRFSEQRVRAVLAALAAADARIVRALPGPPGLDEEPRYEIFHDVLAPAILGWRAQWSARQQAEAAARRQLEQRARRWRRRQAVAIVLVAVLLAAGAGLAARQVADARAEQEATEAQAAALRKGANAAGVVAARSTTDAYIAQADTVCTKGWAAGKVRFPDRPPRQDPEAYARWLNGKVGIGQDTLRQWRDLRVPATINPKVAPILNAYERGLGAYAVAAALLATGYTEEGGDVLRRADQTGRDYRRRARRAGFQECDTALPL